MYIRYHEAEKLFIMYPTLQSILESLQLNLKRITEDEEIDNTIYTLIMGNKRLDGTIPTIGNVSDSTGNLAVKIPINQKILAKEITKDILKLSIIIQKIELAKKSFSKKQTLVMELFYWGENSEKMTWGQVVRKTKPEISVTSAKKERNCAVNKIVSISKITLEDYNWIVKLVKGEEGE